LLTHRQAGSIFCESFTFFHPSRSPDPLPADGPAAGRLKGRASREKCKGAAFDIQKKASRLQ